MKLIYAALCMGLAACSLANEPHSDAYIAARYAITERCKRDPFDLGCCSYEMAKPIGDEASGSTPTDDTDWTPQAADATDGSNVEVLLSQPPLDLGRGASIVLDVKLADRHPRCDKRETWENDPSDFLRVQLASDPRTWVQYNASGRVSTSYAGDSISRCEERQRMRVFFDLRPGYFDNEDRLLGRVGVATVDARGEAGDIAWQDKDKPLARVQDLRSDDRLRLVTSSGYGSVSYVKQYEGTCANASKFETLFGPLSLKQLELESWADSIAETAFTIDSRSEAADETWEVVYTGESNAEVGTSRQRSMGYTRTFDSGSHWRPVHLDADSQRSPTLAIGKNPARVIAYGVGESDAHLEYGFLRRAGKIDTVGTLDSSDTRGVCKSLSHPALSAHPDGGFLLYFACCAEAIAQCPSGVEEKIWVAKLDAQLHLVNTDSDKPRAVVADKALRDLLTHCDIVNMAAIVDRSEDDARLWLLMQDDMQQRTVYLVRYDSETGRFELHSDNPVLNGRVLCPDSTCMLDSIAIAPSARKRATVMLAVTSEGAWPETHQLLHVLRQPLEISK